MKLLLWPLASMTNLAFILRPEKQITSDSLFFSLISFAVSFSHSIPLHFFKSSFWKAYYENDALFRLEIRKRLREIINLGFHDAYRHKFPDKEGYTFWDYTSGAWQKNNGMRIDHFLVSNSLINIVKDVKINKYPRGRTKPSDHTPIEIELT